MGTRIAAMAVCLMVVTQMIVAAGDVVVYTSENAPAAPALESLPLVSSVTQFGITWTFDSPARVGRFVNGDYYVVGPVTVAEISPRPANGRNGSVLNFSSDKTGTGYSSRVGFDSRVPHGKYDGALFRSAPIALTPGDALVSSISIEDGPQPERRKAFLWDRATALSFIRTAAVLTCLRRPVPADAFRPGYADRAQRIYLARNLKRELLPKLAMVAKMPTFAKWERLFERPWLDVALDEFGAPLENMPVYGREISRATSIATLMLAMDIPAKRKETLLRGIVQVGVDLWGLVHAGKPGWSALGGHGSGRKWPIIFTGMMLGDKTMMHPRRTFPALVFSEDQQTMFGPSWTGAMVVYAGHLGAAGHRDAATRPSRRGWGAYEHLPPEKWESKIGESYRRCCTSMSWVGTALAIRIYDAPKLWDHDAFLAYDDRWMTEDDTEFIKIILEETGADYDNDWSRQGMLWDPYVMNMWNRYRGDIKTDRVGQ